MPTIFWRQSGDSVVAGLVPTIPNSKAPGKK
jgi:hypothetical protein